MQSFRCVSIRIHTYTSSCLVESAVNMTDTHPCLYARLIACTNTHTPLAAFFFNNYRSFSFTRNLDTYYTSVGRVFLVETVVSQTVLRDIRAWSAFILVYTYITRYILKHTSFACSLYLFAFAMCHVKCRRSCLYTYDWYFINMNRESYLPVCLLLQFKSVHLRFRDGDFSALAAHTHAVRTNSTHH